MRVVTQVIGLSTFRGNYGLFFRFWDKLFGTEVKGYAAPSCSPASFPTRRGGLCLLICKTGTSKAAFHGICFRGIFW